MFLDHASTEISKQTLYGVYPLFTKWPTFHVKYTYVSYFIFLGNYFVIELRWAKTQFVWEGMKILSSSSSDMLKYVNMVTRPFSERARIIL